MWEINTVHKILNLKGIYAILSRIWKCRKSRVLVLIFWVKKLVGANFLRFCNSGDYGERQLSFWRLWWSSWWICYVSDHFVMIFMIKSVHLRNIPAFKDGSNIVEDGASWRQNSRESKSRCQKKNCEKADDRKYRKPCEADDRRIQNYPQHPSASYSKIIKAVPPWIICQSQMNTLTSENKNTCES